jgi:RNA polymerase sigma-70 factor (ECF subfamily)
MKAARAGSAPAADDVFRVVLPRLLQLIRFRLGPDLRRRIESQDVLQATLLKAFTRLEQFDGSGHSSMMHWLGAIARNEIRDQLDYQGRKRRDGARNQPLTGELLQVPALLLSAVTRIHLKERELQVEGALERLPPDYREVILLRKYEELSYAEIGRQLGKTADASRMLFARAMTALTRELECHS